MKCSMSPSDSIFARASGCSDRYPTTLVRVSRRLPYTKAFSRSSSLGAPSGSPSATTLLSMCIAGTRSAEQSISKSTNAAPIGSDLVRSRNACLSLRISNSCGFMAPSDLVPWPLSWATMRCHISSSSTASPTLVAAVVKGTSPNRFWRAFACISSLFRKHGNMSKFNTFWQVMMARSSGSSPNVVRVMKVLDPAPLRCTAFPSERTVDMASTQGIHRRFVPPVNAPRPASA
mmetsp:Transcript_44238/g.103418  ORF Transcript_44238/g.103418 Transcript_44238/m.103418 type:complete len:232 (-) Transcript_44238:600-1295(-)